MPTLTFPTLSSAPVHYAWMEQLHADPTIVTPSEQGCILSRLRATVQYKRWTVQYRGVSTVDKLTIEAFQASVGTGADKFYYTCPTDETQYLVRLVGPISFRIEQSDNSLWQIDFQIYGLATDVAPGEGGFTAGTVYYYGDAAYYYATLARSVPILGAGVDISDEPCFACPDPVVMKSVGILTAGIPVGIDNTNTAVITIKDGAGSTIATKTYNTSTQPPTNGYDSLDGALNVAVAAGEAWTVSLVQGPTADMPKFFIITTFYVGT